MGKSSSLVVQEFSHQHPHWQPSRRTGKAAEPRNNFDSERAQDPSRENSQEDKEDIHPILSLSKTTKTWCMEKKWYIYLHENNKIKFKPNVAK